jgi:queuosine precursor transporter
MKWLFKYKYSVSYIVLIVLLNTLFAYIPLIQIFSTEISPMDWSVGVVYVLRDFAQRELEHKVIFAMFIGSLISYVLAGKDLAIASMSAFLIAEFVDWSVYSFTKWSLSQRILWSASLSAPIDSIVFLWIIHQLNWLAVLVLSLAKIFGVMFVWYGWRNREKRTMTNAIDILTVNHN